jgi:hypothetical protein
MQVLEFDDVHRAYREKPVRGFRYGALTPRLAALALAFTAAYALSLVFGIGLASWYRLRRLPAALLAAVFTIGFSAPLVVAMVGTLLSIDKTHHRLDYGILLWLSAHLPTNAALLIIVLAGMVAVAWFLVDWQNNEAEITGLPAQIEARRAG